MNNILTIAGIKFCIALLGVEEPNYEDCSRAIMSLSMYNDKWYRSPTINGSMPKPFVKPNGVKECIEWSEYEIYDGSKGTSYFCWRPARYRFDMNTATFSWVYENE